MATYRLIYPSFWTDAKVVDDFTPEDKYFYLYLMTNPHTNICGCYEISKKQIARETGYNEDTVSRLIVRMKELHGVIDYSEDNKEVLLINWHKYNWSKSDNLLKGVENALVYIKTNEFKEYIIGLVNGTERVYRGSTDPIQTSVSVSVTDNNKCINNKHPSVEEVSQYVKEKGYHFDAEAFVSFYESNGWKVGKNPMKDWKSACVTWEKREKPKQNTKFNNFEERKEDIDSDIINKLKNKIT